MNISTRRVGGLRFVKVGRLCVSFCVTREYRGFEDGAVSGRPVIALVLLIAGLVWAVSVGQTGRLPACSSFPDVWHQCDPLADVPPPVGY